MKILKEELTSWRTASATSGARRSWPTRRVLDRDLIAEEDMVITVSQPATSAAAGLGVPAPAPRGKGVIGAHARRRLGRALVHRVDHDYLMFFTEQGQCYCSRCTRSHRRRAPPAQASVGTSFSWKRMLICRAFVAEDDVVLCRRSPCTSIKLVTLL